MNLYMFRAVPLPIIGSSLTAHLALVYVIRPGPARKLSSCRMTYTSAKCTVSELLMMGRGTARNI